jgi:hypothetical protein
LNTHLAKFFSVVFHPLLMPTLLLGLLFLLAPGTVGVGVFKVSVRLSLLSLIFINTFLVPALLIYYFYRAGFVKTLQLTTLADRRLPYFVTVVVYAFASFFFGQKLGAVSEVAPQIGLILASITVSIFLVAIVSLRWQISAHAVGVSGVVGVVWGVMLKYNEHSLRYPLVGLVVLSGYVLAARLQLNAHTPAQVSAGFGLGLLVSMVTIFYFFS